MDMFTKCIVLEQENEQFPVEVLSFGPGIIDTEMQKEIRNSNIKDFIQLDDFISYKENASLNTAEFVAEKVISLLRNNSYHKSGIIDINDIV